MYNTVPINCGIVINIILCSSLVNMTTNTSRQFYSYNNQDNGLTQSIFCNKMFDAKLSAQLEYNEISSYALKSLHIHLYFLKSSRKHFLHVVLIFCFCF